MYSHQKQQHPMFFCQDKQRETEVPGLNCGSALTSFDVRSLEIIEQSREQYSTKL